MGKYRNRRGGFDQNVGKPGVVYILVNDGLHPEFIKIGCSTRSGNARAADFNSDANTGTPALYRCIFEHRTRNCGLAERKVFAKLHHFRRGKFGQEFFQLDPEYAKPIIVEVCTTVDFEEKDKAEKLAAANWARAQKLETEERVKAQLGEDFPWLQKPVGHREPAMPERPSTPISQTPSVVTAAVEVAPSSEASQAKALPKNSGLPWAWITLAICLLLTINGLRNSRSPSGLVPSNRDVSSNYAAAKPPEMRERLVREVAPKRPEVAVGGSLGNGEPGVAYSDEKKPPVVDGEADRLPPRSPVAVQVETESGNIEPARPKLVMESITVEERASINAVCSKDKYQNGPAAYNRCLSTHLTMLERSGGSRVDLSSLSRDEKISINSVCSTDKYQKGPVAYNSCLKNQLRLLRETSIGAPDLSSLSRQERVSINAACSTEKYSGGPAKYNNCLLSQMIQVERSGIARPDLSGLTKGERSSVEAVCATDKYQRGPAAYNRCLQTHLQRLR